MQQPDGLVLGRGGRRLVQQDDQNVHLGRLDGLQRRQPGGEVKNGQRHWQQIIQTGLVWVNRMVQSDTTESSSTIGSSMCSSERPSKRAADHHQPLQHTRARRGEAQHVPSALAQAGRVMHACMQPRVRWDRTRPCSTGHISQLTCASGLRAQVADPARTIQRAHAPLVPSRSGGDPSLGPEIFRNSI